MPKLTHSEPCFRLQDLTALVPSLYTLFGFALASRTGDYSNGVLWKPKSRPGDVSTVCVDEFGVAKFGDFVSQYCQATSPNPYLLEFPSAHPPFFNSVLWILSHFGPPIFVYFLFVTACFSIWILAIKKASFLDRYLLFCLTLPSLLFAFDRGNIIYILLAALVIGLLTEIHLYIEGKPTSHGRLLFASLYLSFSLSLTVTSLIFLSLVLVLPWKALCKLGLQTGSLWLVWNVAFPLAVNRLGGPSLAGLLDLAEYAEIAMGIPNSSERLYGLSFANLIQALLGVNGAGVTLLAFVVVFAPPLLLITFFRERINSTEQRSNRELQSLSVCVSATLFQITFTAAPYQTIVSISMLLFALHISRANPRIARFFRAQIFVLICLCLGVHRHVRIIAFVPNELSALIQSAFVTALSMAPLLLILVVAKPTRRNFR